MKSINTEPLHVQRDRALDAQRRAGAKIIATTRNVFFDLGMNANRAGEPYSRNESDPWRAGWLHAERTGRA